MNTYFSENQRAHTRARVHKQISLYFKKKSTHRFFSTMILQCVFCHSLNRSFEELKQSQYIFLRYMENSVWPPPKIGVFLEQIEYKKPERFMCMNRICAMVHTLCTH